MEISQFSRIYVENTSLIQFSVSHFDFPLFIRKPQIQTSIICARNKRRKFRSARSTKLVLESAYYIASKLKILPEPLDFLIKEFSNGGGNGGGFGFGSGYGWGGFDGWGGKRRRKGKMGLLGILVILGIGIWLIFFGKELMNSDDVELWVLGFFLLIGFLVLCGWRKIGIKDWALGFSSCAVLVSLALKKEDFQRLVKKNFGVMKLSFRRRKRRAF